MRWSPSWVLDENIHRDSAERDRQPGRVVLSAGLDRIVEIDGLFDDDIAQLHTWSTGGAIDPADGSPRLVDQLIGLGVLIADICPPSGYVTQIAISNEPVAGVLATSIANRLRSTDRFDVTLGRGLAPTAGEGLMVALRTGGRLELERDDEQVILHVDLRHDHTLVVGPTEIVGLSACDGCYDTRLARRWPLPALPDLPGVLDTCGLVSELIVFHIERFVATGTHLVNSTIAHSLLDGTAQIDALLRVPNCSHCEPVGTATGRVRLPWHKTSRATGDSPL